jgi:hypothetical protein
MFRNSGSNTKKEFAVGWMPHRSTAATSSVLGDPPQRNKQSTKQKQRTKQNRIDPNFFTGS